MALLYAFTRLLFVNRIDYVVLIATILAIPLYGSLAHARPTQRLGHISQR